MAIPAVLLAASTAWFFLGREARGRHEATAQLWADAPYYYSYLPSIFLDHDLDFANQYQETKNWYRFGAAPTGRPANPFGIGPAIFELPFFGVGHLAAWLADGRTDGFSEWEIKATLFASVLYSLGAIFFALRLLRRKFNTAGWPPLLATLCIAMGGPLVYYAIRQPGYAHPFASFWVAWLVERWDATFDGSQEPRSLRTWLTLGALWGAATLARPQLALWGSVLAVAAADDLVRRGKIGFELALRWILAAVVAFLVFAPQLMAWKGVYGTYYLVPQGNGFMRWDEPAWSEVLFSSRNGLLPWSPIYALAALGFLASVMRYPRLALCLLVGAGAQVVVNGAVWDWWAGGSFGGRRFDSCFVVFAFGLGFLLDRAFAARRWPVVHRVACGLLLSCCISLALGNLLAAGGYEARTVRINGGEAASAILTQRIPGPLGWFVGGCSAATNLPMRLIFAFRYGTHLGNYDRVVGVHFLSELYPGLNSIRAKTRDDVPVGNARSPFLLRLRQGSDDTTEFIGRGARILVPLNRRGSVKIDLTAAVPVGNKRATLTWNGSLITEAQLGTEPSHIVATITEVRRGVNVLDIDAPAGTSLYKLVVTSSADPR